MKTRPNRLPCLLALALLSGAGLLPAADAQARGGAAPVGLDGPEVVLELAWGSGDYELGKRDGNESSPEGPMSFTVSPEGDLYVLDQVNFRVVRFYDDGTLADTLDLPADTFHDIEVTRQGEIVVLDRLVRTSVVAMAPDGEILGEHDITGPGIPLGGLVSALFAADDGVWLEYTHAYVVRVLDERLEPCPRIVTPGRLYEPGHTSLGAVLDQAGGAQIWINDLAMGDVLQHAVVEFSYRIDRIIWMETDEQDNIYVMFHLMEFDPADPARLVFEGDVGVVFDPDLNQSAMFDSPFVITEHEQLREFKVAPDGTIYQMAFAGDRARILRWRGVRP